MPVYNEASIIGEFLNDIYSEFNSYAGEIIVIDDFSNDTTPEVLKRVSQELKSNSLNLNVTRNKINMGHGPTTIKALAKALEYNVDYVISVDGDAQFLSSDLKKGLEYFIKTGSDVFEGVRAERQEFWFRNLTSLITRLIVFLKCKKLPIDANTPFRIYRADTLLNLLAFLPKNSLIPNIFFSIKSRRLKLCISEYAVKCLPHNGSKNVGTTWNSNSKFVPSLKFMIFCSKAFLQLYNFNQPYLSNTANLEE
jgi:glycosyltransferase involved in cell wall biosynthesis